MVNLRGGYDYDLEQTGLFGGINYDMIAQQPPSYVVYKARVGNIYIARLAEGCGSKKIIAIRRE